VNTEDAKVGEYLRKFTFLDASGDRGAGSRARRQSRRPRGAQGAGPRGDALVHGAEATEAAIAASQILFGAEIGDTPEAVFEDVIAEIPNAELERAQLEGEGATLIDLLVLSGLCPSKGQARRDLEGGGIYVNNSYAAPRSSREACILLWERPCGAIGMQCRSALGRDWDAM
jgi:tyrosyl-tRNA synthetase